nr:MAG TPA: hypothetical protein [Caudoviricetes sp.]
MPDCPPCAGFFIPAPAGFSCHLPAVLKIQPPNRIIKRQCKPPVLHEA